MIKISKTTGIITLFIFILSILGIICLVRQFTKETYKCPGAKSCCKENCSEHTDCISDCPYCVDNKCSANMIKKKCGENCTNNIDCGTDCPYCNEGICKTTSTPMILGCANKGVKPSDALSCINSFPSTRSDKGAGMAGYLIVNENGEDNAYYVAASYNNKAVNVSSDHKKISFSSQGSRVYLTSMCPNGNTEGGCQYSTMKDDPNCGWLQIATQGGFKQFCLYGKTLELDFFTNPAGCCCDLAFYFVSMPGVWKNKEGNLVPYDGAVGDFYCDGNAWSSICPSLAQPAKPLGSLTGNGADYIICPELDIVEANKSGIHITPHGCSKEMKPTDYLNTQKYGSAGLYMSGDEFEVNTWKNGLPYDVTITNSDYGNCSKDYNNSICDGDGWAIGNAGTGVHPSAYFGKDMYGRLAKNKIQTDKPIHIKVSFGDGVHNGEETLKLDIELSQGSNKVTNSTLYPNKKADGTVTNYGKSMLEVSKKGMVMVISYWKDTTNTTAWLDGGNPDQCTPFSKDPDGACKKGCDGECPYNMQDGCTNPDCPIQSDCPPGCETCMDGPYFSNIKITTTAN